MVGATAGGEAPALGPGRASTPAGCCTTNNRTQQSCSARGAHGNQVLCTPMSRAACKAGARTTDGGAAAGAILLHKVLQALHRQGNNKATTGEQSRRSRMCRQHKLGWEEEASAQPARRAARPGPPTHLCAAICLAEDGELAWRFLSGNGHGCWVCVLQRRIRVLFLTRASWRAAPSGRRRRQVATVSQPAAATPPSGWISLLGTQTQLRWLGSALALAAVAFAVTCYGWLPSVRAALHLVCKGNQRRLQACGQERSQRHRCSHLAAVVRWCRGQREQPGSQQGQGRALVGWHVMMSAAADGMGCRRQRKLAAVELIHEAPQLP